VLFSAPEKALALSKHTFLSSWGAWERLELLRSTGEVNQHVWEVCMWLLDHFTIFWCGPDHFQPCRQLSQVHLNTTALNQSTLRFDHPGIVIRHDTLPNNPIDYNSSCWWIVLYCIKEWEIQTLPMRNHNAQHLLTFLTYLLSSLIWLWLFLQSLSLPLSLLVRPLTPWQVVLLWYITGCIVIMLSLLTLQIYP